MAALENLLKNLNLFVDGRSKAGNVEEVTLPKLTIKTEEMRAGGMDMGVDVDMGMEKQELGYSLSSFDPEVLKLVGLAPGNNKSITIRGALESEDGTVKPAVINARGKHREADPGTWKPGDKASLKMMVTLDYYKLTIGGEVIHEIDAKNMIRIIDGVDQLAEMRAALGV